MSYLCPHPVEKIQQYVVEETKQYVVACGDCGLIVAHDDDDRDLCIGSPKDGVVITDEVKLLVLADHRAWRGRGAH